MLINTLAEQAEAAATTGDRDTVYNYTKRLPNKFSSFDKSVNDKDKKLLTTQNEQLERLRKPFMEVLNRVTAGEQEAEA